MSSTPLIVLASQMDNSINIVEEQLVGFLESRYVRRSQDYFVCYLSSQTGCNRGCKFCHLTATKQTLSDDSTVDDYIAQASRVFEEYRKINQPARFVHFSFMARGEPLASRVLQDDADEIFNFLHHIAKRHNLLSKFNISTIMPTTLKKPLEEIFQLTYPTIYYSLYSMNPEFRQKWMPGAMDPYAALNMLKSYQYMTKKIIRIHYAFIEGENDSLEDISDIVYAIKKRNLAIEWNIVRYNPFSPEQGKETSEENLENIQNYLAEEFPGRVKMIKRVGFDVKASCGMFVDKEGNV